jgi:hypothetical protein
MFKGLFIGLFTVAILSLPAVGYFSNIYKLVTSDFEAPYKSEIVRGIGIPVFFVGAIAGFVDIGDEK